MSFPTRSVSGTDTDVENVIDSNIGSDIQAHSSYLDSIDQNLSTTSTPQFGGILISDDTSIRWGSHGASSNWPEIRSNGFDWFFESGHGNITSTLDVAGTPTGLFYFRWGSALHPQLLQLNNNDVLTNSSLDISGYLTVGNASQSRTELGLGSSSDVAFNTVNTRDVATDGTKLDTIETNADVTDETNVTAAINGATLTAATVASDDKVLMQDTSDTNNMKTVTAQSIADLGSGGSSSWSEIAIENSQPAATSFDVTWANDFSKIELVISALRFDDTCNTGDIYIQLIDDAGTTHTSGYRWALKRVLSSAAENNYGSTGTDSKIEIEKDIHGDSIDTSNSLWGTLTITNANIGSVISSSSGAANHTVNWSGGALNSTSQISLSTGSGQLIGGGRSIRGVSISTSTAGNIKAIQCIARGLNQSVTFA